MSISQNESCRSHALKVETFPDHDGIDFLSPETAMVRAFIIASLVSMRAPLLSAGARFPNISKALEIPVLEAASPADCVPPPRVPAKEPAMFIEGPVLELAAGAANASAFAEALLTGAAVLNNGGAKEGGVAGNPVVCIGLEEEETSGLPLGCPKEPVAYARGPGGRLEVPHPYPFPCQGCMKEPGGPCMGRSWSDLAPLPLWQSRNH